MSFKIGDIVKSIVPVGRSTYEYYYDIVTSEEEEGQHYMITIWDTHSDEEEFAYQANNHELYSEAFSGET